MNIEKIIEICSEGGIVALDSIAVVFMFLQGKFYLNKAPKMDDYLVFRNASRREQEMLKDKERWRKRGAILYRWLPWIILASLCLVAITIILSQSPE